MAAERTFLRALTTGTYDMRGLRMLQTQVPHVIVTGNDHGDQPGYGDSDPSKESSSEWRLNVDDEPFITQSLQVHTKRIAPGGKNAGHAHQNEAAFYIVDGHGYEIHDERRYEWKKDDLVLVHADSVHQHFNASQTEPALCIVFKAKAMWMFGGLLQQGGEMGPLPDLPGYGPRVDWSLIWTPGVKEREKVVRPEDTKWEVTESGTIRTLLASGPERPDRYWNFSLDMYEQKIAPGSHGGRRWQMVDEVFHVLSGRGTLRCWDVAAEFDGRYYARIAEEPTTWSFKAGDTVWVPPNTVHQFSAEGEDELHFVAAQNRALKQLGYERTHVMESAPEWAKR